MAKTTLTKTNPDKLVEISISEIFTKVFGTRENPNDAAAQADAIKSLSLDEAIGFCAYIGRRIEEFSNIFAAAAANSNDAPTTAFPDENCLLAVKNKDNGEMIGGISVTTETKTTYSTSSAKGRLQVLGALKDAGLTDQYTKTTVEVDNKKLATAKENKTLPPAVSAVFTVTETPKRVTKFQKLATEQVEE